MPSKAKNRLIGAVISTLLRWSSPEVLLIGAFGRLNYSAETVSYDQIIPTMLSNNLSDVLIGIVLILVLSASMSTLRHSSLRRVLHSCSISGRASVKKTKNRRQKRNGLNPHIMRILRDSFRGNRVDPNNLITSLRSLSWGALRALSWGRYLRTFHKKTTKAAVYASFASASQSACRIVFEVHDADRRGRISILSSLVVFPGQHDHAENAR
jgi:SSS family solute:Na+ symporter